MSFDDWMNKNHGGQFDMPHQRDCYEAGAASRQGEIELLKKEIIETQEFLNNQNCIKQAEIDELKKELEILQGMHNAVSLEAGNLVDECDEMQKRIDEALEILEYNEYVDSPMQALEILKGQNNG